MKKEEIPLEIMNQRIEHNMSQTILAQKMNVSQRSISLWENGEVIPRKTACIKLSQVFNLPIDYFFIDEEKDRGKNEEKGEVLAIETRQNDVLSQRAEVDAAINTILKHYGDADTAIRHLKSFRH